MNNTQFLKAMDTKLRAARKAKGIYLRDLGKMCNLHPSGICEIENGKRNSYILTLKILAEKLDVDKRVLVNLVTPPLKPIICV